MELVPSALESEVRDLARIYAEHRRWDELTALYAKKLETISVPERRAEVLVALADILRREYDDGRGALRVLLEALYESPRDDEVAKRIESVAHGQDAWAPVLDAVNAWVTHPALEGRPSDRVDLCVRAAKWYGDLGHPEWGAAHVEKARSLAPADVRVAKAWERLVALSGPMEAIESARRRVLELDPTDAGALEGLERTMRGRGALDELLAFLEGLVSGSTSARMNPLRIAIARLVSEKGNDARALAILEEAIRVDRTDAAALRAIELPLEKAGRFQDLLRVLDARLLVDGDADRTAIHLRIATILEEQFLDPDRAAIRLRERIAEDPEASAAYVALARMQAKRRRFADAIDTLEMAIEVVQDPVARASACLDVARMQLDERNDPAAAIDALERGMKLDAGNDALVELLVRAYERAGDLKNALRAMVGVAHRKEDPLARADALFLAAAAHRVKLGDALTARRLFLETLRHAPGHLGALGELRAFAIDRAEFAEAAEWIDRLQSYTENATARAKLLVELGELRRDRLQDPDGALLAFEAALALDDGNWHAAVPVAHAYFVEGRNDEAASILAKIAGKTLPPDAQRYASVLQGNVADARGDRAFAFECYARAVKLGDHSPRTLRAWSEAAIACDKPVDAMKALRALLAALPEEDPDTRGSRVATMRSIGEMRMAVGDLRGASTEFERVLALDPEDRGATECVVTIAVKLNAWDHVAQWEDRLLSLVSDEDERRTLLRTFADRWKERDRSRARELLERLLETEPTDRKVLHEILAQSQALQDWNGVVRAIERIVAIDPDRRRRAKYRIAAAKVARDQLKVREQALAWFDSALDDDPRALDAFAAIDALLTETRDFVALERAYRKMVHRAKRLDDRELDFKLWHALGLIYRDRLGEPDKAVEAFRMAAQQKPDDTQERRIVAELLEVSDRADLAVAELLDAIDRDPLAASHHRALYQLHLRRGDVDRAFMAASALIVLEEADEEMRTFHDGWRPRAMPAYTARLVKNALRPALAHRDLDPHVSTILATVVRAARVAKARASLPPASLTPRKMEDPSAPSHRAAAIFFHVATMLGVDAPQLWIRRDLPGTIAAAPLEQRATVIAATLLDAPEPDVVYAIAKHLASRDGEHALRAHFAAKSELRAIFRAAVALGLGSSMSGEDVRTARALADTMTEEELRRLRAAVARFAEAGGRADIDRWMQCSDLSATRAGLLACGDLVVAARMVRNEPTVAGEPSTTQKLEELVRWAVSERHHELRRAVGIDLRLPESGTHAAAANLG